MSFNLKVSNKKLKQLKDENYEALRIGDMRIFRKVKCILMVIENYRYSDIAEELQISRETIRLWIKDFLLKGMRCFIFRKPNGRPSRLSKSQKRELIIIIKKGPESAGFPGGCWRSPMIQTYIYQTFGVLFSVNYISQLLKNLGFSYQKAKFVSDHKDEKKRKEWIQQKWPEILKLSKEKNAYILFGDEASFPQWGSLSYTWAPKGKQPVVKTSGIRKGYKVFGLIDYWTGRFFSKSIEKKFSSETYSDYLKGVMSQTRKHLIIIQDGARYHTSKAMKDFFAKHSDRITVFTFLFPRL